MFVNARHGAGKRRGNGSRRQLSRALSARIDEVRVPRRRGTVQVAQERADEWQRQMCIRDRLGPEANVAFRNQRKA